jgi:HK97 family phage portal protein
MAYWDTVINSNPYQSKLGAEHVNAYAAQYPVYEISTPQYPQPSPYNLAVLGFRANELVYSCIQKRMDSVCEPSMLVYTGKGKTRKEIETHDMRKLIKNPCEGVTEKAFWQITELNLLTSGFAVWEKERNRLGQVMRLWPMRPDWCSFYRGEGKPIRAVRYQPYGLPPIDVPRENVVIFQYFDPIYPLLKGLSPTAVALRSIGVDNAATDFLKIFFQQGSVVSGLLSSDQSLGDIEASRIRDRWKEVHGGVGNWGDIAVLGSGSKYQPIGTNFKDMAFQELDGRDEARICMVMKVPPILIGAKVGLTASTYSNYEQAREAYYEETVSPQWGFYKDETNTQVMPEFEQDTEKVYCEFDTGSVSALQENKDAAWKRGVEAAKANIVTRDEAREEMGLDPIDNAPVFVGPVKTVLPGVAGDVSADNQQNQENQGNTDSNPAMDNMDQPAADVNVNNQQRVPVNAPPKAPDQPVDEAIKAAKEMERKQFKEYASKRKREGHPDKARQFKFKHLDAGERAALLVDVPVSAWRSYP